MEITPTPVDPMTWDWYVKQEVDDSDNKSEMEMSMNGVIKDMEKVLYEEERARVLGQVNLELARLQLENERRQKRGLKTFYVLDNTTQLKLYFHLTQGEETNAFAPTTIQHFVTQDFTPTLEYEEHRDMAEEGEDSEEDWNETTLDDTLETISGYEFKYEGVETENENDDTDDSGDGDLDENESKSEVNGDEADADESDGDSDENEGQMQVNDENDEDDHADRELRDVEDELLGDSLNDSMEITQETEEELLGPSDAGLFAASTPSITRD